MRIQPYKLKIPYPDDLEEVIDWLSTHHVNCGFDISYEKDDLGFDTGVVNLILSFQDTNQAMLFKLSWLEARGS